MSYHKETISEDSTENVPIDIFEKKYPKNSKSHQSDTKCLTLRCGSY